MPGKRPRPLSVRVSERAHGGCSEGYRWLRLNYARLRKRMEVRYPPYAEVAAEMAAEGVMGGQPSREKPITEKAVRRMWPRVCRDVEADGKRRAPRQQHGPPGWKPTAFAPTQVKMPPAARAPALRETAKPGQEPLDDVDARLAAIRREMDERSGR